MTLDLRDAQHVLAAQPFSVLLGTRITEFGSALTCLELEIGPELLQQHGLVHGGVIAYLVDNAVAFAAGAELGPHIVTAGIGVDYLSAPTQKMLRAKAWLVGRTSTQAAIRCDVYEVSDAGDERLCATGQGRASIRRGSTSSLLGE